MPNTAFSLKTFFQDSLVPFQRKEKIPTNTKQTKSQTKKPPTQQINTHTKLNTVLNLYLFLYIFKLWTKQLYEDGDSSCLDHYSSLKGISRGNICQHPRSFKLENEIQVSLLGAFYAINMETKCLLKPERSGRFSIGKTWDITINRQRTRIIYLRVITWNKNLQKLLMRTSGLLWLFKYFLFSWFFGFFLFCYAFMLPLPFLLARIRTKQCTFPHDMNLHSLNHQRYSWRCRRRHGLTKFHGYEANRRSKRDLKKKPKQKQISKQTTKYFSATLVISSDAKCY